MTTWEEVKGSVAKNFPSLVRDRMRSPDAIFIRGDDGRVFTYGEFWSLSGRIANTLAQYSVRSGDRVAAQVHKSIEALALFLACARLGAIFLPLNPAYTVAEVSYFIGDAEPSLVICDPAKAEALAQIAGPILTLDDRGGGSLMEACKVQWSLFDDAAMDWDDAIAILYTSGTTGKSKGALLSHGNLASNAATLVDAWRFTAKDVLIHALPVYHTHGLFTATNTVLLSGGRLLFRRKFDVDDVISLLPKATTLMGVPTFYTRLLEHKALTRRGVKHMRLFISGSAPLLAETQRQFEEKTGHAILERFGMTETSMNTSNPYEGERRAGTVGPSLTGIEVRVTDPASGAALPSGEIGSIEVRGPNVFKGYWRMPEKTAQEFRADGFFITGDLGSFDDDGYLTISGRSKDLVISGGFNIYPKEIEAEIDQIPDVLESAVIGLPHPDLGEVVTAIVVLKSGRITVDEAAVIVELQKHLAKFKIPKRIIAVAELPRNAMGKVQKSQLRETYAGLFESQRRPV